MFAQYCLIEEQRGGVEKWISTAETVRAMSTSMFSFNAHVSGNMLDLAPLWNRFNMNDRLGD